MSFFDQQKTNDGKPYGPIRYKQIVNENYIICKQCNMSYSDVLKMTPTERDYILEFIKREIDEREKMMKER